MKLKHFQGTACDKCRTFWQMIWVLKGLFIIKVPISALISLKHEKKIEEFTGTFMSVTGLKMPNPDMVRNCSVADPRCLTRTLIFFYPGYRILIFFLRRSRVPDSGSDPTSAKKGKGKKLVVQFPLVVGNFTHRKRFYF